MTFENNSVNNMFKYQFFIGCNDKDTLKDNYKQIKKRVIKYFDNLNQCYTLSEAVGRYQHDNGRVVNERTLIVTIFTYKHIGALAIDLKKICNQESILVTADKTQTYFY